MQKITTIDGIAAPLMVENISTDIISPSELYLKSRDAYGPGLFGPWRYDALGRENPDFVLSHEPFREAQILVAGRNFGCGSSRQIAVWCLQDFGIRCVIAPSFGDIFSENAFKSGLLAIELPAEDVDALVAELQDAELKPTLVVDLIQERITLPSGRAIDFRIDPFRRAVHLEGVEEIEMIMREEPAIAEFQEQQMRERPWILPARPAQHVSSKRA